MESLKKMLIVALLIVGLCGCSTPMVITDREGKTFKIEAWVAKGTERQRVFLKKNCPHSGGIPGE